MLLVFIQDYISESQLRNGVVHLFLNKPPANAERANELKILMNLLSNTFYYDPSISNESHAVIYQAKNSFSLIRA